jgi:hypothetical protein
MKPALTPEEWRKEYLNRYDEGSDSGCYPDGSKAERGWTVMRGAGQVFVGVADKDAPCMVGLGPTVNHAMAALCLHDQPFGFTREDVWELRYLQFHHKELQDLADRIEALLPPEDA